MNETLDFIRNHREENVRTLALQGQRYSGVDMTYALQQIDGWQRARQKLPMWAKHEGIIYPPHISMEQCSSEVTARYKQELVAQLVKDRQCAKIADLTGGFGVDFSYMSQGFHEAYYVEQQEHLCDIARHNFEALGIDNSHIIHGSAEDALESLPHLDVIYLDPARRDTNGKKTYAISDCTPDVTTLLPLLRSKADHVIVKLSPMLDHREAVRLLPGVSEVHIISVHNECKETLLVINGEDADCRLICVNDENRFVTSLSDNNITPIDTHIEPGMLLCVPNASVMKAGCFGALCAAFGLAAVGKNSHLFRPVISAKSPVVSGASTDQSTKNSDFIERIPARTFTVQAVCSMNKREMKAALTGVSQANVAVRNFPLSVDALKKKINGVCKLRDGGETYIFGTTVGSQHMLIVCTKY